MCPQKNNKAHLSDSTGMRKSSGIVFKRMGPITIDEIKSPELLNNVHWKSLLDEIRKAIHQNDVLHLLLDFHRVEHVSVEFFGEVNALVEENATTGGTTRVCGLREAVLDVLKHLEFVGAPPSLYMGASTRDALLLYLRS